MSFNIDNKPQERKSRRTHKNSKDGCPNCKAKRIKCTEELPSCFNCIKRNYRCGYIDFPKEKLDHIRKKNEKKRLEGQQQEGEARTIGSRGGNSGIRSASSSRDVVGDRTNNYTRPDYYMVGAHGIGNADTSGYVHLNSHSVNHGNRMVVDSHNHHPNAHNSETMGPASDWPKGILFQDSFSRFFSNVNTSNNYHGSPNGYHEPNSMYTEGNDNMFGHKVEIHNNTAVPSGPVYHQDHFLDTHSDNNKIHHIIHHSPGSNPLPNAIHKSKNFSKVKELDKYSNFLRPHVVQEQSSVNNPRVDTFRADFSPIWTHNNADSIWRAIYRNSTVYPLYYNFFMDRALNFILTRRNRLVSSQVYSPSALDNTDSEVYSSSSSSDGYETMIKYDALRILVNKSYVYYGNLINVLRKSLNEIDIVYSTKISVYSYYTTFLHFHGTTETACLMITGTASLVTKVLHESPDVDSLDDSMLMLVHWFNAHTTYSLAPDYNFSIIEDIYGELKELKKFITENRQYAADNSHLIGSILDLQSFLVYLITVFQPQVVKINNYYKSLNGIEDSTNNIYFTSFTLFFQMLKNWFKIFPSQALSINSKESPLKKVFYLFFPTLGKALVNVFSPLRSMLLIDLLKVFYPSLDFDESVYDFGHSSLTMEQYAFLNRLSTKLLRIHTFFNNRISYYAYHLSNSSVLQEPYIKAATPPPREANFQYHDILHITPTKLSIQEQMLEKLSGSEIITSSHYPNMHFMDPYDTYNEKVRQEEARQRSALNNRRAGMASSVTTELDFDPTQVIAALREHHKKIWYANPVPLDDLRFRHYNFDVSFREINDCVKKSEIP